MKIKKVHALSILVSMRENRLLNEQVAILHDSLESFSKELSKNNRLGFILLDEIKSLGGEVLCSHRSLQQKIKELSSVVEYLKTTTLNGLDQQGLLEKLRDQYWASENKTLVEIALGKVLEKYLKEPLNRPRAKL